MSHIKRFSVSLPSDDEGFVGRACTASGCKQYFKVFASDHKDVLHCPYCGAATDSTSLLTPDQFAHVRRAAVEEARVYAINEIQKVFKNALRGSKSITYKPGPAPRKRPILPTYSERKVDTELRCAECETRFQVYGIFGYCPGCQCENLMIYDANWAIIKKQLLESSDQDRQLRHAYGDLVSTFEVFCKRKAKRLSSDDANFQSLFDARKFFKDHAGIDMLANISPPDLLALRRVFQKRHVCIHAGGEATDQYVRMIPEDKALLGSRVALGLDELELGAKAMRHALADLVRTIEAPGR